MAINTIMLNLGKILASTLHYVTESVLFNLTLIAENAEIIVG